MELPEVLVSSTILELDYSTYVVYSITAVTLSRHTSRRLQLIDHFPPTLALPFARARYLLRI
jgi:hypothetical protein